MCAACFLCCVVQSRPFGVALLVAGWQEGEGPVLYHTDPSGMFVQVRSIHLCVSCSTNVYRQSLMDRFFT